ncbi:MAG: GSU2403 family nucleotidyltransferase fold protein [Planctomycetota bacterium]
MITRHPEDTQTLHAEALALLLALESDRTWSHLSGSFTTKAVKGREYVYFQYSDLGGAKRQLSIGKKDAALDKIIRNYKEQRILGEADRAQVKRLAGLLRAAGIAMIPHGPARVIRALADAGVFAAGGMLMGPYAFQVLGNLLGLEWPDAAWRTQDVDIAGQVQIAIPSLEADVPKALDSLRMGFIPVPQLDPRHASTSFRVRGKQLRVDLITPGSESDSAPIQIRRFNAAAAPIKYLSLSMREAQPAAAIESTAATLVVVPSPARFALHKLLVSQTRSVIQQTKSGKDLHQAALFLESLAEDRPEDLEQTAAAFCKSGPAVTRKVKRGLQAAVNRWPDSQLGASIVERILGD